MCKLDVNKGAMHMLDVDQIVETIEIKTIYSLIHSNEKVWNTIGKYYLKSCDSKFQELYFICKCTDIRTIYLDRTSTCNYPWLMHGKLVSNHVQLQHCIF